MKMRVLFLITLLIVAPLAAQEGSVVCIHGFFRTAKNMLPMARALRHSEMDVYLWEYRCTQDTIEGHAEDLVRVLNRIAANRPHEPIHFATHSFGGIVLRTALNHPECPEEAKMGRAVLLAPPNQGARIAHRLNEHALVRWYLRRKAGRQLLSYDEEAMASLGMFPESMNVMVVAGKKDWWLYNLIVPGAEGNHDGRVTVEETYLPTPHKHVVIDVGHNKINRCREAISLTYDFLNAT